MFNSVIIICIFVFTCIPEYRQHITSPKEFKLSLFKNKDWLEAIHNLDATKTIQYNLTRIILKKWAYHSNRNPNKKKAQEIKYKYIYPPFPKHMIIITLPYSEHMAKRQRVHSDNK